MIASEEHPNFARLTALLNQQRSPRKTLNTILSVISRKEEGAMPYYIICPLCGAALDPGERCDCTKEKAPGTAATVTSARKEHPQPKDTTKAAESKETDRDTRRILESIARLDCLPPHRRIEIAALVDAWAEADINGGPADQQAGG